jgi:nicotinamide riboside kinase
MFGAQPEALQTLARRRYDLAVLCENDFGFVQDGTRQNVEFQRIQQAWYEARLNLCPFPVLRVRGSLMHRLAQVRDALSELAHLTASGGEPIHDTQPP